MASRSAWSLFLRPWACSGLPHPLNLRNSSPMLNAAACTNTLEDILLAAYVHATVSPRSADCTVTASTAPEARFTARSALCASFVRPSFIRVMRAEGSCGLVQSSFDAFFLRSRMIRGVGSLRS